MAFLRARLDHVHEIIVETAAGRTALARLFFFIVVRRFAGLACRALPADAERCGQLSDFHAFADAVGAARLSEFRQAADDAVGMREACAEIRRETMLAEKAEQAAVHLAQQVFGPVVGRERLRQHVDEVHAIARVDEIRRALAVEPLLAEAAQALGVDLVEVDVEAAQLVHELLLRIGIVILCQIDERVRPSSRSDEHLQHILIICQTMPLSGLRVRATQSGKSASAAPRTAS